MRKNVFGAIFCLIILSVSLAFVNVKAVTESGSSISSDTSGGIGKRVDCSSNWCRVSALKGFRVSLVDKNGKTNFESINFVMVERSISQAYVNTKNKTSRVATRDEKNPNISWAKKSESYITSDSWNKKSIDFLNSKGYVSYTINKDQIQNWNWNSVEKYFERLTKKKKKLKAFLEDYFKWGGDPDCDFRELFLLIEPMFTITKESDYYFGTATELARQMYESGGYANISYHINYFGHYLYMKNVNFGKTLKTKFVGLNPVNSNLSGNKAGIKKLATSKQGFGTGIVWLGEKSGKCDTPKDPTYSCPDGTKTKQVTKCVDGGNALETCQSKYCPAPISEYKIDTTCKENTCDAKVNVTTCSQTVSDCTTGCDPNINEDGEGKILEPYSNDVCTLHCTQEVTISLPGAPTEKIKPGSPIVWPTNDKLVDENGVKIVNANFGAKGNVYPLTISATMNCKYQLNYKYLDNNVYWITEEEAKKMIDCASIITNTDASKLFEFSPNIELEHNGNSKGLSYAESIKCNGCDDSSEASVDNPEHYLDSNVRDNAKNVIAALASQKEEGRSVELLIGQYLSGETVGLNREDLDTIENVSLNQNIFELVENRSISINREYFYYLNDELKASIDKKELTLNSGSGNRNVTLSFGNSDTITSALLAEKDKNKEKGSLKLKVNSLNSTFNSKLNKLKNEYICYYEVSDTPSACVTCPVGSKHAGKDLTGELLLNPGLTVNDLIQQGICDVDEMADPAKITCPDNENINLEECICDGGTYEVCKEKLCPPCTEEECPKENICLINSDQCEERITKYKMMYNIYCPTVDADGNSTGSKLCGTRYHCPGGESDDMDPTPCINKMVALGYNLVDALNYCEKTVCPYGGSKLQYRVISLENPFPGENLSKSFKFTNTYSGRYPGINWLSNNKNENVVYKEILNNRKVNGSDVYNQEPLYEFDLDAAAIKQIRKYNKSREDDGGYNDFGLECNLKGVACISNNFLRNNNTGIGNYFTGGKCKTATSDNDFKACAEN